jgi:hypothetical protein
MSHKDSIKAIKQICLGELKSINELNREVKGILLNIVSSYKNKKNIKDIKDVKKKLMNDIYNYILYPSHENGEVKKINKNECKGIYQRDDILYAEIDSFEPNEVFVSDGYCFHIDSILEYWERSFSLYDKENARVAPKYPRDYAGNYIPPNIVRGVAKRVKNLKEKYPLLYVLLSESKGKDYLLDDIYNFIIYYDDTLKNYAQIFTGIPDIGYVPLLRDYTANNMLLDISKKYNFYSDEGYFKYIDIAPTIDERGGQIFYSCLLTAFFISKRFSFTYEKSPEDDSKWIYTGEIAKCEIVFAKGLYVNPCRTCRQYIL